MIYVYSKKNLITHAIISFLRDHDLPCEGLKDLSALPKESMCLILDDPKDDQSPCCPVIALGQADKYPSAAYSLEKPLSLQKLLEACQEILSRKTLSFSVGPYTVCAKTRQAMDPCTDTHHSLTEKEVEILELLHARKDTVSRDEILKIIWGYQEDMDTHTLETHIYKLRKKLFPHSAEEFLVTTPNGYCLKSV